MCLPRIKVFYHVLQHDAQMDYYGKRLATCSSDKTIKVSIGACGRMKRRNTALVSTLQIWDVIGQASASDESHGYQHTADIIACV
jgi:hypothetical protein